MGSNKHSIMRYLTDIREHLQPSRRSLLLVLVVALINGLCWTFLIPPFQGPDENTHFAFTQHVAETGNLPSGEKRPEFSTELNEALNAINYREVQGSLAGRPPFEASATTQWEATDTNLGSDERKDGGGRNMASGNPPLYYGYQAVFYKAASGDIFQRLAIMRLASLLFFLGTVAMCWALAEELFGSRLWPRVVASLTVALLPMVAYVLTVLNPDSMLTFLYSGIAYFGVRTLKRGPTPAVLLALGAFTGLALMTKLISPAVLPAVIFVYALALWRIRSARSGPSLYWALGASAALALAPVIVWSVIYPLIGQQAISGTVVNAVSGGDTGPSVSGALSYLWQWYLPKLPFMETFPRTSGIPVYHTFLGGFWGAFGPWLLLSYPEWLRATLAAFSVSVVGLSIFALVRRREQAINQWGPILFLVLMALALAISLHYVSYITSLRDEPFFQSRYVFPLISIFGIMVALAVSVFAGRVKKAVAFFVVAALSILDIYALALNADRFFVEPDRNISIALLPNVFERAAQYGTSWEGAWLYWLLFLALLAIPVLAILAVKTAFRADKAVAKLLAP